MPVPTSIKIVADSEWKTAPHVPFKMKRPFVHSGNILTMIRAGGCLRGLLGQGGAGCFEVMSKRELREEGGDVKVGRGRRVSSWVISQMIQRQEIYVAVAELVDGAVVYACATVDEIVTDGFAAGFGVSHKPYVGVSHLFRNEGEGPVEICIRPKGISFEEWTPIARAMSHGIAARVC